MYDVYVDDDMFPMVALIGFIIVYNLISLSCYVLLSHLFVFGNVSFVEFF